MWLGWRRFWQRCEIERIHLHSFSRIILRRLGYDQPKEIWPAVYAGGVWLEEPKGLLLARHDGGAEFWPEAEIHPNAKQSAQAWLTDPGQIARWVTLWQGRCTAGYRVWVGGFTNPQINTQRTWVIGSPRGMGYLDELRGIRIAGLMEMVVHWPEGSPGLIALPLPPPT